jgi:ribosomal-protein-alanine N-acetyltransferase
MLKTNRLNLRPFSEKDLDLLYSLHANPQVAATTIDGIQNLETVKKHLKDFIEHQKKHGFSQWAVFEKEGGKFVGRAGLTKKTLSKEVGEQVEIRFAFLPEFWGKGYASEVTQDLINFAFKNLKLEILAASNRADNERSSRVLIKNGFKFIRNLIPEGYGTSDEIRYYLLKKS